MIAWSEYTETEGIFLVKMLHVKRAWSAGEKKVSGLSAPSNFLNSEALNWAI